MRHYPLNSVQKALADTRASAQNLIPMTSQTPRGPLASTCASGNGKLYKFSSGSETAPPLQPS